MGCGNLIGPQRLRRHRHGVGTRRRADAVAVDGSATLEAPVRFAPGTETCDIVTEFRRGPSLQGARVSLNIKDRDNTTVHDSGVLGLGGDRRSTFQWDGRDTSNNYITLQKSPYTLTLRVGNAITRTRQVRVEHHSINIWTRTTDRRIDTNTYPCTLDTAATVKIKRTNGSPARAHMPVEVKFSFIAGGSNTSRSDSFEYATAGHHRLGKGGHASAVFWEAHSSCTATSGDSYRQTCKVNTITSGSNRGKAFIKFKPSGVGGDTYRIVATIYWADGTNVMLRERGPVLTVWRKIHISRIYTMHGESYIDTPTREPQIDPAYETHGYTMYSRGGMTTLSEALSPTYIGLYVSGAADKSWPNDLSPQTLETSNYQMRPTAQELSRYAYTGADAARVAQKNSAKTAIEAKAALWFNAIVQQYRQSCNAWFADAGISSSRDVILAVKYYHPKLSNRPAGATNFWPAGIQINLANPGSGRTDNGDPDGAWRNVQGFNRGRITVIFKNYGTTGRLGAVCRHEVGHATRSSFKRDEFGTGDHSASGLMTYNSASNTFSNADLRVLRGYHR